MGHQKDLFEVPKVNSVQQMLLNTVDKYKDKLALEDLNKTPIGRLTYNDLLDKVLRFGNSLKKIGLAERSHIALISENRVQWAVAFLTSMTFNYVIVPIDRNLTENEILNIVHESDSEAIIFSESYEEIFSGVKSSLKKVKHLICMDEPTQKKEIHSMVNMINSNPAFDLYKLPSINPNESAEIIFTSGSLGRAKGVMLSQKNLASNLVDMVSMLFMHPEDKFLSVLPMHHTYECTCGMLCPLYCGSSIHYARSLKTVTDDLNKVSPSILLGVPLLYDKMFKKISKSINEDKVKSKVIPPLKKITNLLASAGLTDVKKKIFKELHARFGGNIRVFIAGGAAPDPEVAKGLREFGFSFLQGYGLTETSPILALNRINDFKDNAAGLALPSVEIKITNPDETGSGEIYAKGPNVMLGYYKNPKLTAEVFDGDWFKTGDIGFIDKDGFLHINGRQKNVIISKSGKNVFPEEIEDSLNRSPYILESIVHGSKDEKQDEIIAAQIVVDAEALIHYSEIHQVEINDELIHKVIDGEIKHINKTLAPHKRVIKFTIRDKEFEKTTTQKIKRYLLNGNN